MKKTIDVFVFWYDKEFSEGEVWYKGDLIATLTGSLRLGTGSRHVAWDVWCVEGTIGDAGFSITRVAERRTLDESVTLCLAFKVITPRLLVVEHQKKSLTVEVLMKEHPDWKEKNNPK